MSPFRYFVLCYVVLFLVACNPNASDPEGGIMLGQDDVSNENKESSPAEPVTESSPTPVPTSTPSARSTPLPNPSPSPLPLGGVSCNKKDSASYCIGVKYVAYKNSSGNPVVSLDEAAVNLKTANSLYSACNIGFQMDEYLAVNPVERGLNYNTANYSELDDIRNEFVDNTKFLLVTTGPWNRNGSLGNTGANAWASMPGNGLYGIVLESPVGTYSNIIAHELGHYLNLDHAGSSTNLMSALIYENSTQLSVGQCQIARSAVDSYWKKMLR